MPVTSVGQPFRRQIFRRWIRGCRPSELPRIHSHGIYHLRRHIRWHRHGMHHMIWVGVRWLSRVHIGWDWIRRLIHVRGHGRHGVGIARRRRIVMERCWGIHPLWRGYLRKQSSFVLLLSFSFFLAVIISFLPLSFCFILIFVIFIAKGPVSFPLRCGSVVFGLGLIAIVIFVNVLLLAVVMGFGTVMVVVLDCFVDDIG